MHIQVVQAWDWHFNKGVYWQVTFRWSDRCPRAPCSFQTDRQQEHTETVTLYLTVTISNKLSRTHSTCVQVICMYIVFRACLLYCIFLIRYCDIVLNFIVFFSHSFVRLCVCHILIKGYLTWLDVIVDRSDANCDTSTASTVDLGVAEF